MADQVVTSIAAEEVRRISASRSQTISGAAIEPWFDDLTVLAAQICRTPIAFVSLIDESGLRIKAKVGIVTGEIPPNPVTCAPSSLDPDQILEIPDTLADPRFAGSEWVTSELHVRFYAGATLVSHEGQILGSLCVMDRMPRTLSEEQRTALRVLSRHVVAQMELLDRSRKLAEETQSRKRAEAVLRQQNEKLTRSQAEASRLLELAGQSRGALLSILEDEQLASKALVTSLREKEALLKEVHHRVKNNLQVIASLLRLEGRRIDHPMTRSVLREMQGRIQSMALLHETLYRSGNFARVDLAAYLTQLTSQLFRSLAVQPGAVRLSLDLAPVLVEIDQAIPCGLIVNELASNCLKHGFPEGRSGEVSVRLRAAGHDGSLTLSVADNGVGLPADFDLRRTRSLGLQLVSDLARQLQGSLFIGPGPETLFEVTFAQARMPTIEIPPGASRDRDPDYAQT